MIKLEHTVTASPYQMQFIIEGMRNPMNSWAKSDSDIDFTSCWDNKNEKEYHNVPYFNIGENDYNLMDRLAQAGSCERKFLRMMPVYVRITAPLYWWKEFDTYKVGTVSNSCSTMHKIQSKPFSYDDFSVEHLNSDNKLFFGKLIARLNTARLNYLSTKSKADWWQMIQLLPSTYNQTRNIMLNYETLANIYQWRKNHKLDEWREFCKWIEKLPYAKLIADELISFTDNIEVRR